jgi:chaperone LolA
MRTKFARLRQTHLPAVLFWILLAAMMPVWSQTVETSAAVAGIQKRYAAIQTLRAEFTQRYRAPGIDQKESGTMYLKKPGLMRWEYRTPETKLFIADGRDTYLYTPQDRQVVVQRFTTEDLRNTPLQFLLGKGDIRSSYDVAWDSPPSESGDLSLRLTPKAKDSEYSSLAIQCDRATFELRRMEIRERSGNISEFEFRQTQTNPKLDDKTFKFNTPKGVEVVRMEQK